MRNPDHEIRAAEIIRRMTGRPVICGHDLSPRLDAVKRAATTILNAHLIPIIHHLIDSVQRIFRRNRITAPLMIVRGDGSLMAASAIMNRPIETILSGPAASVIGARFLLGREAEAENAVIVDIGGTTTDMALLRGGLPCLKAGRCTDRFMADERPGDRRPDDWSGRRQPGHVSLMTGISGWDRNGSSPSPFLGPRILKSKRNWKESGGSPITFPLKSAPDFWVARGEIPAETAGGPDGGSAMHSVKGPDPFCNFPKRRIWG